MVWAQTIGGPHGGPLPVPVVSDLVVQSVKSGDVITITGTGFTPGSQIILEPGSRLVGAVNPVDTTTANLTIPYGLPNIKHKLYVDNGNRSNGIDLFITRSVSITAKANTTSSIVLSEMT